MSAASHASAAEKIGFFFVGGQYERDINATDSYRVGVGLPLIGLFGSSGAIALSGDLSYLRHTAPLTTGAFQPYYGGGLGLGAALATNGSASAAAVSLYPNVLGGANYAFTDRWSAFAEASAGPRVILGGGGASIGLGFGIRLGANYKLR
ncbi:hypothetical protein [Deinococcus sp. QL22]|uniref:hypothetical protein n=1 Tax=Deinococcus sp. QL22 TaxID=2939437 RepID=UPI002017DAA0|nr:hypothetical protein [Deinococcus sp. QL22]UQN07285.1 hypothetical protein M1R55_05105 [Deinococcus sp. QL22]